MSSQAAQIAVVSRPRGPAVRAAVRSRAGKFIELGHLQPTDLLWREGFPDWRPAMVVFPPRKRAGAAPPAAAIRLRRPRRAEHGLARQAARGARSGPAGTRAEPGAPMPNLPRWKSRRAGGGSGARGRCSFAWPPSAAAAGTPTSNRERLMEQVQAHCPRCLSGCVGDGAASDRSKSRASPLKGFSGSPEAVDATLQATPLWRVIKRDYPDWYAERLKESGRRLPRENKDESPSASKWRARWWRCAASRSTVALGAGFPQLKAVASSVLRKSRAAAESTAPRPASSSSRRARPGRSSFRCMQNPACTPPICRRR